MIVYNSQKRQSQQKPGPQILILLVLALMLSAFSTGPHRVAFVCDGDTVILECGEAVRYIGIDSPERGGEKSPAEPLARESRAFNRSLVEGRAVWLEFDRERRDRYGRLLAYVRLEDGTMVNSALVQSGLAAVMITPPNTAYFGILLEAQQEAMTRGIGLWKRTALREEGPYVGSSRSYRFHSLECPYGRQISRKNLVIFDTLWDAFWEGYSPCSRCVAFPR
jgi:endonuclease YncB( thermonuclease family)